MTRTHSQFVEAARLVHGDKYIYEKEYAKSLIPLEIKCPLHGVFTQKPKHHLVGKGCKKCGSTYIKTFESFVESAKRVHGDKYTYVGKYVNEKTKTEIVCPVHGSFHQTPTGHIHAKQGCSKCSKNGTSKASTVWLNSLNIPGLITFASPGGEYRIPVLKYKVDGYDEKTNTVYEYHGAYWHGHPSHKDYKAEAKHPTTKLTWEELYEKTIERDKKIIEAGYNLVVKWGVEKNNE